MIPTTTVYSHKFGRDVVLNVDDAPAFLAADAAFAPASEAPAADAPADAPEAPAKRSPGRPPKGKA